MNRTKKKSVCVYKFKIESGEYILTEKAVLPNLHRIERIIKQVKVKNDLRSFELIQLGKWDYSFLCLVERKELDFDNVSSFINYYTGGERTEESHSYKKDLLDNELLDDLGIVVLTYKHFYSGTNSILTCYKPVYKTEVTDELKNELKKYSEEQIEEAARIRKGWAEMKKPNVIWESI